MEGKSLWGTIPDAEPIKTPYAILKEQGAILESLTNSLLVSGFNIESSDVDNFQAVFKIIAPTLGNFSVAILRIQHKISIYPVSIWKLQASVGDIFLQVNNKDEFEK